MEFKSLSFDYECKQTEINGEKVGIIRGHAAAFSKDLVNDIIEPGAFTVTLREHQDRGRPIRMKFQHRRDEIIGGFPSEKAFEDGKGLFVEGHINLQVQKGAESFSLAKQGVLTDMSIGFGIQRFEIDLERDVRILKEIDLSEISIVDDPANTDATIIDVKTVTPFLDLPLANRDRVWDSDQAIQRVRRFTDSVDAPSREYRRAFLWFDGENADEFGAYKLPYADVINGELKAVPRALFAVAAVLNGARGGVDIPEADQTRIKRNVARYFEKMDLESPFKEAPSVLDIKDIQNMKDLNIYLKSFGVTNRERNILVSKVKEFGSRDADDSDTERDAQIMSEFAKGLGNLNAVASTILKGA